MKPDFSDECLAQFVKEHGSPLYVYDLSHLSKRIDEIRAAFPYEGFELLFASMANPSPSILSFIADKNVGACVNSIEHLDAALVAGISPHLIQFSSTGLTFNDMETIFKKDITINLDSVQQTEMWFREIGGKLGGMRLNAACLIGRQLSDTDRIGSDVARLLDFEAIAETYGGKINGIHVYVGTNFLHHDEMMPTLLAFFRAAEDVTNLEYINIGGGIGIDYLHKDHNFDLSHFGKELTSLVEKLSVHHGRTIRLIFEPGRGLIGQTAVFLTKVTDMKSVGDKNYVGVDASISVFPRPFHHPENPHSVRCLGKSENTNFDALVVGRTTFSRDILARGILPSDLVIGDVLVLDDAGAYCDSMRSRFLGQPEPKSIFIGGICQ